MDENYQIVLRKSMKLNENEIDLSIIKDRETPLAKINITVKYKTQRSSLIQQIDVDEDEWTVIRDTIDSYLDRAEKAIIRMKDIFSEDRYVVRI
ncbi:MAG TPA: hypothetical protein EYP30_03845 [Archaeoglobaceae archaeon]|nr:hypothetical protein [Archaeoglobaceae archaeon]